MNTSPRELRPMGILCINGVTVPIPEIVSLERDPIGQIVVGTADGRRHTITPQMQARAETHELGMWQEVFRAVVAGRLALDAAQRALIEIKMDPAFRGTASAALDLYDALLLASGSRMATPLVSAGPDEHVMLCWYRETHSLEAEFTDPDGAELLYRDRATGETRWFERLHPDSLPDELLGLIPIFSRKTHSDS